MTAATESQISKACPKCGRDYSGNPNWKSNLRKHLARKNPCDQKGVYIRDTLKNQDVSKLFRLKSKMNKRHEFLTFYERENGEWEVSFTTRGFFNSNLEFIDKRMALDPPPL